MSAPDLVDTITGLSADRLLVARALDPSLRGELEASVEYEELPFIRGRTVVPEGLDDADLVVAGHPNFLGIFDLPAAPRWVAVGGTWSSLAVAVGVAAEVAVAVPVDIDVARRSRQATVELAKQVSQLRGVTVAFPPASPVLIVLVPTDPATVAARMSLPGCTALSAFEELPGGVRIEPPPGAGTATAGYAQALREALEQEDQEVGWRQRPAP